MASLFSPLAFFMASTVTPYFWAMRPRFSPLLMVWVVAFDVLAEDFEFCFEVSVVLFVLVEDDGDDFLC